MRGSRVAADTDDAEALRAVVGQLRTHLEMRGRSGLQGVGMGKSPRAEVATSVAPSCIAGAPAVTVIDSVTAALSTASTMAPLSAPRGKSRVTEAKPESSTSSLNDAGRYPRVSQ